MSVAPTQSPEITPRPAPARSGLRRWRTWIVLAAISVGWKVLVFTLGAAMPQWLISDGVAEVPAELRPYATQAIGTARALWNGPIERHGLVRTVRVVSVDTAPDADSSCGGLSARVRAYTYFAIPYSEVRTRCERGTVEYRVFRRKRHRDG